MSHYSYEDEDILKAIDERHLSGVSMNAERTYVRLDFTSGEPVFLEATSECCSRSYIASTDGVYYVNRAIGRNPIQKITKAYAEKQGGELKIYGIVFEDNLGQQVLKLELRNESNGYYGGSLKCCAEPKDVQFSKLGDDF